MQRKRHQKVVVGWDEEERRDHLTGFRKRKQQRREQAIIEMVEKARKDKIIERQERRAKQPYEQSDSDHNASDSDDAEVEQVSYTDDFSKERFGASNVTVTTVVGFDGGEDSDDDVDALKEKLAARHKEKRKKNLANEEKRIEKAMEARVKRMKEVLLKQKRKGKKKGNKAKRVSGKKHSRGKRK